MAEQQFRSRQKKKTIPEGYRFLLVVCFIYFGTFLATPERAFASLQFSFKIFIKLIPIMAFVFVLMFVLNLLIKPQWVKQHVGQGSGMKGYLIALIGGIFSMGPIYIWFEFLKEMQQKGMRTGLIATFIYARSVKPQLLPMMVLYFGWTYTVVLEFYLLIFSLLHGWLIGRLALAGSDDESK
jgi:uncharacterized membrane protein YraQ (UPF0718 family)